MQQYLDLLRDIKDNGIEKTDRTGVGTYSLFGRQIRCDLSKGFPLLTTKKMFTKGVIVELLWFLKGETNVKFLHEHNVHIWDEWADQNGDLGPVYGKQWRNWVAGGTLLPHGKPESIDQISNLINDLKTNPFSRRHIISAWNPADIPKMALAPCHCLVQFNVRPDKDGNPKFLDCQLYQRSCDVFLGVPFNIASYALLTMMIANVVEMEPGDFVHTFGDVHIYKNHVDQVEEQLGRETYPLPTMTVNPEVNDIFGYTLDDFSLTNYKCHPKIEAPIAI